MYSRCITFNFKAAVMVLLLLLGFYSAWAIPAIRKPIQSKLPDGTTLTIFLHGDENFSWITTKDGYLIARNAEGFFEYVGEVKGEIPVLTGVRVHEEDLRKSEEKRFLETLSKGLRPYPRKQEAERSSRTEFSIKGTYSSGGFDRIDRIGLADRRKFKGILVPVHFRDLRLTYGQGAIDSLMNVRGYDKNGAKGSVRDYFYDMSRGRFDFQMKVLPPYTARFDRNSYGKDGNNLKEEVFRYLDEVLGERAREYDLFPDGRIDHVSIIFAGYGQESTAEKDVIWSNNSYINSASLNYGFTNISLIAELDNRDGVQGMETFCHEFGHALGLPDFYCVQNCNDVGLFPDEHELMSANTFSGYPVPMSSFSTYILGWTSFKTLDAHTPGDYMVPDMLQGNTAFRYYTTTPGEFFVFENRSSANKWQDRDDLGRGMLIFRVDSAAYAEYVDKNLVNSYENYAYQLIRADADPYYYSVEGDYFGEDYNAFTDETNPASLSKTGAKTRLPLTEIRRQGDSLRFRFVSATSPESRIQVVTGRVESLEGDGRYKVSAQYILPQGMECTESGICYGLLPRPTVQGSKRVNETGSSTFEIEMDLESFVYGATLYVRAYATDAQGNTCYGSVRSFERKREKVIVDSCYAATEENRGFYTYRGYDNMKHAVMVQLDISKLKNPILETPSHMSYGEEHMEEGYILVSSDSGDTWRKVEPSSLRDTWNGQKTRFSLPDPSSRYFVRFVYFGGYYESNDPDTIWVKDGPAYEESETGTLLYCPESVFGNYAADTLDREGWPGFGRGIGVFDISRMQNPAIRLRGKSAEPLYVRTDSSFFKRLRSTDVCWQMMVYDRLIGSDKKETEYTMIPAVSIPLPKARRIYVAYLTKYAELEVYDMENTGATIHQIRSADPSSVEVSFTRTLDSAAWVESYFSETGICWSTGNTPSLENRLVLPYQSYSVIPITGLPEQDIYFWTYRKENGQVTYSSRPVLSSFSNGRRSNPIVRDTLNPVTPIAFSEDGRSCWVRAIFPADFLKDAVAQGICYGPDEPGINKFAQYQEGDMQTTCYFQVSRPQADLWCFNIRTFSMNRTGDTWYGPFRSICIPSCENVSPELSGKIYTLPVNLLQEISRTYQDGYGSGYGGDSYWRKKNIKLYAGASELTFSGVGGHVLSPLIVNAGLINPVMEIVTKDINKGLIEAELYLIEGGSTERHLLTTLGGGRTYEIPLRAYGDSIFLEIDISPYSTSGALAFLSWRIDEKLTPTVRTGSAVAEGDSLFFSAKLVPNEAVSPATGYGFIYSPYGDPLIGMEQQAFVYERITVDDSMPDGTFSAAVFQSWFSRNYVRAYAENENGFSYGDCLMVVQCKSYPLQSYSLPVTDEFKAEVYREDGSLGKQDVLCSECDKDQDHIVEYSGSLQLQQPPALNKIHALLRFYVQVDYLESAIDDPETYIKPFVEVTYKRTSSEEYLPLPKGSVYRFDKLDRVLGVGTMGGWNVYFVVEADFPRDFSHFRLNFKKNKDWKFYDRDIEYTESDEVDNFIAAPQLNCLNVENDRIEIDWQIDQVENVKAVRIYRETNQLDVWEMIREYVAPTVGTHSFVDEASRPQTRSYRYVVRSVNSENDEFASAIHKSIHLSINKGIQNQWNLIWNAYEGKPVSTIRIYRGDASSNMELIDELNGGNTSYTDVEAPEGDIYYRVGYVLADAAGTSAKASYYSLSNIATNVEEDPDPEPVYYTVQLLSCEGGEVLATFGGTELPSVSAVEEGSNIVLQAKADPGYMFVSWWDGNRSARRGLVVDRDLTVSATFRSRASNAEAGSPIMKIWPNPVSEKLYVQGSEKVGKALLRDVRGRILEEYGSFKELEISMEGFSSGIYFLEYVLRGETVRCKIVKK